MEARKGRIFTPASANLSDFTKEILLPIESIMGFFNEDDAMHFYLLLKHQSLTGLRGDIFEIGSYFGRSTALLAHCLSQDEELVVCDAFEEEITDKYASKPTVSVLKDNIRKVNPDFDFSGLSVHSCVSSALDIGDKKRFRFSHIDGGHDDVTAYHDISYAAARIIKGGILAIDDFDHPDWPGVTIAVKKFLDESGDEFGTLADINRHGAKGRKLYLIKN